MLRWRLVISALVAICVGCPSTAALSTGVVDPPDPPADDDDDSSSSSSSSGGPATRRCNPTSPFRPPLLVDELDGNAENGIKVGIVVSSSEREIVYLRNDDQGPGGAPTMRRGTRDNPDGTWSVETTGHPDPTAIDVSSIARGGNKLYYYVKIDGINFLHSAPKTAGGFGAGTRLFATAEGPNTGFVVDADDLAYYSFNGNIWVVDVTTDRGFVNDREVVFGTGSGFRPIPNVPQTNVYYTQTVDTVPWIHAARRASKDEPFGVGKQEFPAPEHRIVLWASADDCVLYLLGPGNHIYESRRGT